VTISWRCLAPSRNVSCGGYRSVVLERVGHDPVTIAAVAQPSVVGEIAERLAALQLGAAAPRRLAIVVPLRPGAQEAARQLLAHGPPFDPEEMPELDRHEVFLTPDEAIFVFESDRAANAIAAVLSKPELLQATGAWEEHLAGPPRLAESVYSWARAEKADELSFLPTPGPGDSDGGDIF
jgi:xanthine/CO dehydrogenase XdhC/CoxF family maturation factor